MIKKQVGLFLFLALLVISQPVLAQKEISFKDPAGDDNGSGSFSLAAETLPAGGMGGGVAAADFNGDGRPDLLLANMEEGLLLMRQLPDGSFEKTPLGRSTPRSIIVLGVDATWTR